MTYANGDPESDNLYDSAVKYIEQRNLYLEALDYAVFQCLVVEQEGKESV